MARIKQTTRKETTVSVKAKDLPSDYMKCNRCNGKGYHKKPGRKKK